MSDHVGMRTPMLTVGAQKLKLELFMGKMADLIDP